MRSEFTEQRAGPSDLPLGAVRKGFPEKETGEEDGEFLTKGTPQAKAKRPRTISHGLNSFAVLSDSWYDSTALPRPCVWKGAPPASTPQVSRLGKVSLPMEELLDALEYHSTPLSFF